MKRQGKPMTYAALLLLLAAIGLLAWVRLAPDDPKVWHLPLATTAPVTAGPCAERVIEVPGGAAAACLLPLSPEAVLQALDATALATPRTTRLAGTPQGGRITWISRSRLIGYPDYITAQVTPTADGTRLDILSRQRYGARDLGVNAARLTAWLAAL